MAYDSPLHNKLNAPILIVGCGPMAIAYAKVLTAMTIPFIAVGRSQEKAAAFSQATGVKALSGGLESYLKGQPPAVREKAATQRAIVAVSELELSRATISLLQFGYGSILVEKPGMARPGDLSSLLRYAGKNRVFVGYNRRFYESTQKARQMIEDDGGLTSFHFEFTELGYKLESKSCDQALKEEWFFHNSCHVVDLAFYLGGAPATLKSYFGAPLPWRQRGTIYVGAGLTEKGASFSYHANWGAPGRWGVELLTRKNRYILRPLEKLFIQRMGFFDLQEIEMKDPMDRDFKPGLYRQTEAFLNNDAHRLPLLEDQVESLNIYSKMESVLPSREISDVTSATL